MGRGFSEMGLNERRRAESKAYSIASMTARRIDAKELSCARVCGVPKVWE